MRRVVILGSTGSIGTQAMDVIRSRRDQFEVVALGAGGGNIAELVSQIIEFAPQVVALARPTVVQDLQLALYAAVKERGWNAGEVTLPQIIAGPEASTHIAALDCEVVLNGMTGSAGLLPTLAALAQGTTVALANKESLVVGGRLVTGAAAPGQLVAVDSEHSAFAQALRAGRATEVRRLILTASGGPFRGRTREQMAQVSPTQAMAHPTWDMGRVITINSATLVNKGLELIEAGLLYDIDLADITVVVHPQSIVHSMVEFHDGSTIAQASPPDMRLPIGLGLSWPDRLPDLARPCEWTSAQSWTFEPLDSEAFTAVELARRVGTVGGTAPAVYNAANEVCVDAFCAEQVSFLGIVDTIEAVVNEHLDRSGSSGGHVGDAELSVDAVLTADSWARSRAAELIAASRGTVADA